MEKEKALRINVEFGDTAVAASFDAVQLANDGSVIQFARVDNFGSASAEGIVRIDEDNKKIGMLYDIFTISANITHKKEVNGNLFFFCTNDLFDRIEVFIADYDEWLAKGKSIFED